MILVNENDLSCTFCRKGRRDVQKLVAGPGVYVCDECVGLCFDLIEEEVAVEEPSPGVSVLDPRANALVPRARRLVESCNRAVGLLQTVAERARALADTIEFALPKAGSGLVLTEYANSVAITARHFAKACACDALELPYDVEKQSRTLAGEIEALVAGYVVQPRGGLLLWVRERPHAQAPAPDAGRGMALGNESDLECTFCRKGRRDVRKLIAGPGVFICDECVGLSFGIIEEGVTGEGHSAGVSLLDREANGLVRRARRLVESCSRAVELPESVAERARALAERIDLLASSNAESRMAFTEYATSFAITARYFANACDALGLPRVAERSRSLAKEIETVVAGPHQ